MAGPERERVAVIGGGVAGLSVAHELADAFEVTVFERREVVGGKAASAQIRGLPAEHGFRFFPGFYRHVTETMKDIPAARREGNVEQHLVELDTALITDQHGRKMTVPLPTTDGHPGMSERMRGMSTFRKSMPGPIECLSFMTLLARLATTSDRRWDDQYERQSWLEHTMSSQRPRPPSKKFREVFAIGLTRTFVATRAEEMNARTGGKILLQLLYDSYFGPPIRRAPDRALDGPTTKVWIDPWREHLIDKGVVFRPGFTVCDIQTRDGRVSGLRGRATGGTSRPRSPGGKAFDWYVLAVPCEVLQEILVKSPGLIELDPDLAGVFNLETRWMNGIVLGLPEELDPPLPKGHVLCLGSEWAVTLLDQTKVWSDEHLVDVSKRFKTVLSIDISDWDSPGRAGVPAKWPPERHELVADLWRQLQDQLPQLKGMDPPKHFNLDADIEYAVTPTKKGKPVTIATMRTNQEPLLVNTPESWANRPKAHTNVPNLFLAGDFVRTYTNFASMEAANESARRAAYRLRKAAGLEAEKTYHPLEDPDVWWWRIPQDLGRMVDDLFYRSPLPLKPPFVFPIAGWVTLGSAAATKSVGKKLLGLLR